MQLPLVPRDVSFRRFLYRRLWNEPLWNSSITRVRCDGHMASRKPMDSFREHSPVKRPVPAELNDKLLPASKSCFESRGLSACADRFWTESPARLFRLDTCLIRVRDFYESRRNENRIERKGTRAKGRRERRIVETTDVSLERLQSNWKKKNDILKD